MATLCPPCDGGACGEQPMLWLGERYPESTSDTYPIERGPAPHSVEIRLTMHTACVSALGPTSILPRWAR